MSFHIHEQQELLWLTSPLLERCGAVSHGFSTRAGGVSRPPFDTLNLGVGRGDETADVLENYRRFCAVIGTDPERAVLSKQIHEANVRIVTSADAGKGLSRPRDYTADALISDAVNLPLVVFSADCGILLLYDRVHHAAGAVHAGWRGCAAGIVEQAVRAMKDAYGTEPGQLLAAVGPCIGPCCFETDNDVPDAMRSALGSDANAYLEQRGAKWQVDLAGLNRQWLLRAGVAPPHIDSCGLCTACRPDLFWSHRKMGSARGAQIAMISLNESDGRLRE